MNAQRPASIGEFELIERYFAREVRDPAVRIGIGDDAAVVDPGGPIALTVDTLVEGVHFPVGSPAHALGHRLLAVIIGQRVTRRRCSECTWAGLSIKY